MRFANVWFHLPSFFVAVLFTAMSVFVLRNAVWERHWDLPVATSAAFRVP